MSEIALNVRVFVLHKMLTVRDAIKFVRKFSYEPRDTSRRKVS